MNVNDTHWGKIEDGFGENLSEGDDHENIGFDLVYHFNKGFRFEGMRLYNVTSGLEGRVFYGW